MGLFTTSNYTPEQRLTRAVVALLKDDRYAALSGIFMIGERTISTEVTTAATNGRDEYYNADFITPLSDSDIRGLIVHECKHKIYKHPTSWGHLADSNPMVANMAMDYVINLEIVDENPDGFCTLPEGGLLDEQYRGMSWPEVFELLNKEQQSNPKPDGTGDGTGEGTGEGTGDGTTGHGGWDDHSKFDDPDEIDDAAKRELEIEIDETLRKGSLAASKMGKGGGNRAIEELLKPQIDWREVLREFVASTCRGNDYATWARPNRKYLGMGIYMPSSESESIDELVVLADTSYSTCNPRTWSTILTELVHVCETTNPERVRILYWGSEVVGDEVYDRDEVHKIAKSTKPRDGGGTNVRCVNEYMADKSIKATAIINITDGYLGGDWGTWDAPLLWCILDNKRAQPTVGKVLHIKSGNM